MRVVERDWAACPGQARAKIPERIVGQKGASDDARLRGALVLYDHAQRRAHHALRRFAENAPACLRYLRYIDGRIHFRENHQRHRVIRVERDAELGEEAGKTAAHSTASGSPDKYRLAALIEKPLSASQTSPSGQSGASGCR